MSFATRISQKISLARKPIFQVNWRRLYALPTRHGFMVGLAVFGVFAISVRIQHNMLLLLAVALFVIFLVSVIWAALNLHGIHGRIIQDKVLICGDPAQLAFRLTGRRHIYDLRLRTRQTMASADLEMPQTLHFTPTYRGRHLAPPFLVETHFPFGLVRVWQWLSLSPLIIAPKPDFQKAAALMNGAYRITDNETDEDGHFNADSLEEWMPGTPLSRISWKHYASKDRLLSKSGAAAGRDIIRLYYDDIDYLEFEEALSALCGGILEAVRQGLSFELQLPDKVPTRFTPDNHEDALRLLALIEARP
ncbi:MAG: DUF58 domain-containing protein [Candidatus Puniceispirillaceae bacterium]